MRMAALRIVGVLAMVASLSGCYEELPAQPPQAQTTTPTVAVPQAGATAKQGNANGDSPVATPPTRGTLAGAKRTAENIAQQAEDASQRVADEAEDE